MTFQDLFKEIQDLLYLQAERFTFFSKQALLFSFIELADSDNENN